MREVKTELRVTLKQTLTPQLYQLLKMLQMPYLELEQTVRNELIKNPLLEEKQDLDEEQEGTLDYTDKQEETSKEIDWSDFFRDRYDYSYKPIQTLQEELPERIPIAQKSVRDYLMEQLHLNSRDRKTDRIGEYIIDSLNEDGFLDADVNEIAKVLNVTEDKVVETLKLIQTFDPPGVGSRTLEECLMVQLYMNGYDDNSVEVAIVKNFLREVGSKDINKIKKLAIQSRGN